jgi:hypothetical protein
MPALARLVVHTPRRAVERLGEPSTRNPLCAQEPCAGVEGPDEARDRIPATAFVD